MREEILYWLWMAEGLYANQAAELLGKFGNPERVYKEIRSGNPIRCRSVKKERFAALQAVSLEEAAEKMQKYERAGIGFLCPVTQGCMAAPPFPAILQEATPPVHWLYYKGQPPEPGRRRIAVVGARACTDWGARFTRKLAGELAAAGVEVVSGLAAGIDGRAHEGALEAGGRTLAVLGCGVDVCYPAVNRGLYESICSRGSVVSEYPPGRQPMGFQFPQRNRIISILSDGVLVVEARKRSGSLITAEMGLEQGKNVYAVPGRPGDPVSEGCNFLIQSGAKLVAGAADILEDYELSAGILVKGGTENSKILLETTEKIVYACLRCEPKHVNQIQRECGMSLPDTVTALLKMEIKGYVVQAGIGFYAAADN